MGIFDLNRRIRNLEEKMARIEQDKKCAIGNHKWEINQSSLGNDPYIKCSHCWAFTKEKK